ncbi:hypothetical protein EJ05DRAFT_365757 [Pseudovirgaria hyperparasitica]|uniref:Glycosyl transferase n=1 Tax=Pseudovirgaria hyperparasitica TaxID=470096 RepID=A0A6A6W8E4_9PEZI|nr:uncharacterized protein EJ05DRAFT_365757 [Pseudovirgaria hyperparasitica]KAF2758815.1 hypothetical protein EJ05DRAFT_365757 [Pseudovirgaria hyperparasitica]
MVQSPEILTISAFASDGLLKHWWQIVLVAIIGACVLIGSVNILLTFIRWLARYLKRDTTLTVLPTDVLKHLRQVAQETHPLGSVVLSSKPSSFGVYLGAFSSPPTAAQSRIFSQWDIVILDPTQQGVLDAIRLEQKSDHVQLVGRLDVRMVINNTDLLQSAVMIKTIDDIVRKIESMFGRKGNNFQGILVAGWEGIVPTPFLNALGELLEGLGLKTYLEIAPPNFLEGQRAPKLEHFSGVVVRNATILEDGERRDFFDMDKMKTTTKAFVAQACLRPFTVMMWETVRNDIALSHAVVKRSFMWCGYHGALVWIGSESALTNAVENVPKTDPIASFQWLKENRVMKIHETLRSTRNLDAVDFQLAPEYESLSTIFPSVADLLRVARESSIQSPLNSSSASTLTVQGGDGDASWALFPYADGRTGHEWTEHMQRSPNNPLSYSPTGAAHDGAGCFPVGMDVTRDDFIQILGSQQRLRTLGLLNRVPSERLREMGSGLRPLANNTNNRGPQMPQFLRQAINDFSSLGGKCQGEQDFEDPIQVYLGLDSGFRTPSGAQFWSVFEIDQRSGALIIYVSKNATDLTGTVLHTYLSHRSFQRYQCFLAEYARSQFDSGLHLLDKLPPRIEQDIALLSPTDVLLFMQHLRFSEWDHSCPLLSSLQRSCREVLIDIPSYKQLKHVSNFEYINGTISDEELVEVRMDWYRQHHRGVFDNGYALQVFRDVEAEWQRILHTCDHDKLEVVTKSLVSLTADDILDYCSDFVLFCVFCAARKAAFDEVYLEVSDRNPLFNEFSDQSAAFAELFALGSRCETYFDVAPSMFGRLLSDRHRLHYNKAENQPPMWIDNAPAFASAYAAAQTDIDPDQKDALMPAYRRFTFLSVFAIPALVDIILLTCVGRGLYLSAFMTHEESQYATLALMISLLLSGVIGTWISIGGTYYLISMAFSAANMFVITRLVGGLAFTFAGGILGFVILSGVKSPQIGAVFFFYLVGFTAYLSILAVLSTYQFPGSSFLNGRYVIIYLIPTLLIAPIITMWIPDHDVIIYLVVMFIFVFFLLLGTRWVGSRWVDWCNHIKCVDDAAVKAWYIREKQNGKEDTLDGLSQPAILALCRAHLYNAVMKEKNRKFWQKSEADKLVRELAECWDSTIFLLNWYCRLSDVKRPIPYSSTWNLETQVAYDSLQQNQKGIRLHNSFIHWRNAGDEVGCGLLYFLVALLDRWVTLLSGQPINGILGASFNTSYRVAVGFGLAYYLVGAVLLDYKAQHLHQAAAQSSPISIRSTKYIHEAIVNDAKFKQRMYWTTLFRFLGVHVWSLGVTAALIWIFNGTELALKMFLSYVAAYTGLLLYQYNKIFSGPHVIHPLLFAVGIGLPLGLLLKRFNAGDVWNDVIALGICTWTAAILSIHTAKIGLPRSLKPKLSQKQRKFHHYGGVGVNHEWSQSELEAFYDAIKNSETAETFSIHSSGYPGTEIKSILLSCDQNALSRIALDAFPTAPYLAHRIVSAWEAGTISIELVSMRSVVKAEADIRAISCFSEGTLELLIASDSDDINNPLNVSSNCRAIAETLMHACAESVFGLTHDQALIAESILTCSTHDSGNYQVSEAVKRAMPFEFSESKMEAFALASRKDLLRHLSLGVDCETAWDELPLTMRLAFLSRCLGEATVITADHMYWIEHNVSAEEGCSLSTRIARYDLGALFSVQRYNYFRTQGPMAMNEKAYQQQTADIHYYQDKKPSRSVKSLLLAIGSAIKRPFAHLYHSIGIWIKFFVLATIADPEYHRELNCILTGKPKPVRTVVTFLLTLMWRYSHFVQSISIAWFVFHRRRDLKLLSNNIKGTKISVMKNRLNIQYLDTTSTAFIHRAANEGFKLHFYNGTLKTEPETGSTRISTFSKDMRLYSRTEFVKGEMENEYIYDYPSDRKARRLTKFGALANTKIPMSRTCIRGKQEGAVVQYNYKGHIESGTYMLDGNLVRFKYHYRKNAKYDDELLRADFVLPHMSCSVSWCAAPVRHPEKLERWIPHTRVHEATFVQGADVFECSWLYDHKFHPTVTTKLNGHFIDTPPMIKHDWLGVLKKPSNSTFIDDNPLFDFSSLNYGVISRVLRLNERRIPVSTSRARSQLWKAWKKRRDIDGVVVRWMDEQLLRGDSLLRPYWKARNMCNLARAEDYLALHADAVMASAELTTDISAWTPLAIRLSDLFSFGQGGDAVIYTRTKHLQPDNDDTLHVIAVDTGTWPNEGGGVSACRRDLINNLKTIRWHMVVESANDFGLPKHQTEENVESLKIIPLWGLDFLHPQHGMFSNKLDSEVDHLFKSATADDIKQNFIPTLTALVRGARAINMTQADLKQATRALVNLNTYFQDSRHWTQVWTSDIVKEAWRNLWLADDMPNAKPPNEWFDTELPTLGHLETALDLWFRYLFIFSIPIPEQIPAVFQASHHSVSASYGIVCKIKRNCTLQIWDHAISWRETNLYLSSALCTMPPFIRNSLLGLMKLTSTLTLHHADQILPCADFFNPGWEVEIGTSNGTIAHRNVFKRKVDPIVNGITDMQKFAPVSEIKTKRPTVTMLSHVWFAKDIKTALLAADIITNEWGFKDYVLDIYGALNKAPVYSSECQEIIACKALGTQVTLRGTADPGMVLESTWLFLNSSVSEGLPLALGEAALTGAPVVCTDVGASLRVLTDPDDNERYSEVVAPNDAYALARAQINLLAMIDQWAAYADDDPAHPAPILPIKPTPQDVEIITRRMYEKSDHRRKLGMMARQIVQKSFSGDRYLREHEQMLWIGKSNYEMLGMPERMVPDVTDGADLAEKMHSKRNRSSATLDKQMAKMEHPKPAWMKHGSRATSFSSVYYDEGPSSSRQNFGHLTPETWDSDNESIAVARPMLKRTRQSSPDARGGHSRGPSGAPSSRSMSFDDSHSPGRVTPLGARLNIQNGRQSAMSTRSSQYVPSKLHTATHVRDV